MSRKCSAVKRKIIPDTRYHDEFITKFINALMSDGEKAVAESIFYGAMDLIQERTKEDGMKLFKKAIENVKPLLEVKSRRVGGATYQVPVEVKSDRRHSLACRWIIGAASGRTEHSMMEKLTSELIEASNGRGGAMKKREDVHRMAEANKAFAHFRW